MKTGPGRVARHAASWAAVLALAGPAAADCALDVVPSSSFAPAMLFPNWRLAHVGLFDIVECSDAVCTACVNGPLTGLTIVNYGTATGGGTGDVTALYFQLKCGPTVSAVITMTFAGLYQQTAGTRPAWTWAGSQVLGNPCGDCVCGVDLHVYADIAACPTRDATVVLGPGVNALANPGWPGGLTDSCGCAAPWADVADPATRSIQYAVKRGDRSAAAPGDTVTYTVTYGRPGTVALTGIEIVDTLPPYTHLVAGTAVPPADPGWDPDWGPPARLRWTIAGPLAVTGGPTGEIRFSVTVDWGNGEAFEPGSGDVAAPEGARLDNRAAVSFVGTTCPAATEVTPPDTTVVRRFLFWKLGDNDLLFSKGFGQPPDEMTYSIFLLNTSATKTWWKVSVWDSVPAELDPWCVNCGFEDPCTGWTMTPSGCAAATPGKLAGAGGTLLTWALDMPPRMTLTLRWKAQLKGTVTAGATAVNRMGIAEAGRTGIVGGTGSSGPPLGFAHQAPVVLPTTYVSYTGYATTLDDGIPCPGIFVDFFPLNKKTQFELRGIEYNGAGWSTMGGVSASIGCLIGDCLGGFAGSAGCTLGSGAISGGGVAGCKVERIPARYRPAAFVAVCPAPYPANFIYKLVSNSPVLWQFLSHEEEDGSDSTTMAPATTLTYAGLMHYFWRRRTTAGAADEGDSMNLINTGINPNGIFAPGLKTTVHLFQFNYTTLAWDYRRTWDLDVESQGLDLGTPPADDGPWRTVSSDAQLIIVQGCNTIWNNIPGGSGDTFSTFFATRETGNVVSATGSGTFYGIVAGYTNSIAHRKMTVGNVGVLAATYAVDRYVPVNTLSTAPMPSQLNGSSGTWVPVTTGVVPPGLAAAGNPDVYNRISNILNAPSLFLARVRLLAGGPIQILGGGDPNNQTVGGAVMHASGGTQTGTDFWLHTVDSELNGPCGKSPTQTEGPVQAVNVFCPKQGMAVRGQSESGYTATYTTTGPDQCVSFTAFTEPAVGAKTNFRFTVLPGPAFGSVIAQFHTCKVRSKGYTAPFLQIGVHYTINAPPVVYVGAPFWITVVVFDAGDTTKSDYCGTTSFTSTDPASKIEGTAMDAYNFTWSSSITPCGVSPWEDGVAMFVNVTFNRLGLQTIVAVDTLDGSITGLTAIMVVGADVKLTKEPRLAVAASSDTVQFRICWSNYSSASAFTFVINDAVPVATTFIPEAGTWALNCGSTTYALIQVAYSTAVMPGVPAAASFIQANPVAGTRWLRWTVPMIGVYQTGCACFRVSVQ